MFVMKEAVHVVFIVFVISAIGYLVGSIRIKNVCFGTSAIFMVGLVFGHFGVTLPESIQTIGLVLFITSVGLSAGSSFLSNLKKNGKVYVVVCLSTALTGFFLCLLLVKIFQIDMALGVGVMTGAFTSSPSFAAAQDTVAGNPGAVAMVAAGYGILYPFGTLGKVLFVQLMPKWLRADIEHEKILIITPESAENNSGKNKGHLTVESKGYFTLAFAIVLGTILGAVSIPLPGGVAFSLGVAGGPLIAALLIGHFGHIGPLTLNVNKNTISSCKEIGLILFFSGAGVDGGRSVVTIFQEYGILLILVGLILLTVPLFTGFLIGYKGFRLPLLNALAAMTASMTCSASLAALIQTAETDEFVSAYATTYPIALITLVMTVQLLIMFQ